MGHVRCKARLTPYGRRLLVDRIMVQGWSAAQAAEAMGVSRQTAYRWLARFRDEGEAGLADRSSRPHASPRRVPPETEEQVIADRITEREGPHLMAGRLGMPASTIYKILARRGLSRLSDLDRTTGVPVRYVRDCPGELVHVDIKKLGRVPDGGGWKTRGRGNAGRRQRVGYEYVHALVDDHSRFAYVEVLDSQNAVACSEFVLRGAEALARRGYRIERVMTDNAWAYRRSRLFADALARIGAVHKLIRPYRPQTNGKVERFHQTLLRGWAYKRSYTSNPQRRQALSGFIDYYNHQRPHSSLNGQPPITKLVNHLCEKDI